MFEYHTLFDASGGRANRCYPQARAQEASALLRGRFFSHETLGGFLAAEGACAVRNERLEVSWSLPSRRDAIVFVRDLFGLTPETADAEILEPLRDLGAEPYGPGVRIPWTMNYVSGLRA